MYSEKIMDFVVSSAEGMLYGDEVPVCAAIAIGNEIISTSPNEVEKNQRPWHHAEFLVIEKACEKLQTKYLDTASLYVNLEPCAFCAAVLEKVRIKEIFFGAYDSKCGAITHGIRLFDRSMIKPNIIGGIQERRCSETISKFFDNLRIRK